MARDNHDRRRSRFLDDLDPYLGCGADASLGLDPLAVGWLQRGQDYTTGAVPERFADALLAFCVDRLTVCAPPTTQACPLCFESVEPVDLDEDTVHFGLAEIRVLGEDDIFAAPTLIHHYVTAHDYRPPRVFIDAVLKGPAAGAPEHLALIRTLRLPRR